MFSDNSENREKLKERLWKINAEHGGTTEPLPLSVGIDLATVDLQASVTAHGVTQSMQILKF